MKLQFIATFYLALAVSAFPQSLEKLRAEMGPQTGNPIHTEASYQHPDPRIDALMRGAIDTASRLGFSYDASALHDGKLVITAQWKNHPVEMRFNFLRGPGGRVNYTYLNVCDGFVLSEQGDAKLIRLFEATLADVMDERINADQPEGPRALAGSVTNGVYTDSRGLFTVSLPAWAVKSGEISDSKMPNASRVDFADDLGHFAIVECVTHDQPDALALMASPQGLADIQKSMLETYRSALPTKLLLSEDAQWAGQTGKFFVCVFEGGGTIHDKTTGKRPDCFRGYFLFIDGPNLYTLTVQKIKGKDDRWTPTLQDELKTDLGEFTAGFQLLKR